MSNIVKSTRLLTLLISFHVYCVLTIDPNFHKKFNNSENSFIEEVTTTIPNYKKKIVEIFSSSLGYTLVGQKPVSFEEMNIDTPVLAFLQRYFLNSKEMVFKITPIKNGRVEICLINRKKFIKICKTKKTILQFLKEKRLSANEFLEKFKNSPNSFSSFCNFNGEIEGIFLGFGAENATKWSRWAKLGFFLGSWPFRELSSIPSPETITFRLPKIIIPKIISIPSQNNKFESLYSEWNWLNRQKKCTPAPMPPISLPLPIFYYWENTPEIKAYLHDRDLVADFLYKIETS